MSEPKGGDNTIEGRRVKPNQWLPEVLDLNKVKADFANGILTLHLTKAEAAKPRKIAIKAA